MHYNVLFNKAIYSLFWLVANGYFEAAVLASDWETCVMYTSPLADNMEIDDSIAGDL